MSLFFRKDWSGGGSSLIINIIVFLGILFFLSEGLYGITLSWRLYLIKKKKVFLLEKTTRTHHMVFIIRFIVTLKYAHTLHQQNTFDPTSLHKTRSQTARFPRPQSPASVQPGWGYKVAHVRVHTKRLLKTPNHKCHKTPKVIKNIF